LKSVIKKSLVNEGLFDRSSYSEGIMTIAIR
jgi:hypothetical protein